MWLLPPPCGSMPESTLRLRPVQGGHLQDTNLRSGEGRLRHAQTKDARIPQPWDVL